MQALRHAIPSRMARAVQKLFDREGTIVHSRKVEMLDSLHADDARIPLAQQDDGAMTKAGAIWRASDEAARECMRMCARLHTMDAVMMALDHFCQHKGVPFPAGETDLEILKRATDKGWWRRMLRKEFMRRFEHTAITLGLTGLRADPYITRETAVMQETQNRENQKMLEARTATNENGQSYSVAELAALGTGNKALRKGELMTRINGFEVIAKELHHAAMFGTVTCPGEFHSVGGTNAKYNGATPRDGQAHLGGVWARYRSWLDRAGIKVYGFRIAEPHTDGCPHWHTLLFLDPAMPGAPGRSAYARASAMLRRYALGQGERQAPKRADIVRRVRAQGRLMDGPVSVKEAKAMADRELHEWRVAERARQNAAPGAKKNRVKIVRIDPARGSAAGYIVKYVSKNIDGEGVGAHSVTENGKTTYFAESDLFGDVQITPSQRVTYWSQVWGIRQFQQIGGAPVGVWRELRRVTAETVQNADPIIKAAHNAVQAIKANDFEVVDGKVIKGAQKVVKQAEWAEYLRAQGGPTVGRRAAIKIACQEVTIEGRYATYQAQKPVGVYLAARENEIYESVRYQWTITGPGEGGGVALDLPRTGVNNCTAHIHRPHVSELTGKRIQPFNWSKTGQDEKKFGRAVDPEARKRSVMQAATGNEGDGGEIDPITGRPSAWSKRDDEMGVDAWKNHTGRGLTHLEQLQRKYPA